MVKRTTIEIDEELLARAKRALGIRRLGQRSTMPYDGLRKAPRASGAARAKRQAEYLNTLGDHADLAVLESEEMWR